MRHKRLATLVCISICALVILPIVALLLISFDGDSQLWSHLSNTVLGDYVTTTLLLALGVACLTLILGVGSAIIVCHYNFVGARMFDWALLLPLAMPAYIIAYAYTGLLDVAGPVQMAWRDVSGLSVGEYYFPAIRSMGGAIIVMSFVLYPYVYLLTRAALLNQTADFARAGQSLGLSKFSVLRKITLPIARPAIMAGLALVLMETLADFGVVSYFGLSTFTTGIFRTWNGFGSVATAAQLSMVLLMFVILLVGIETLSRKKAKYHSSPNSQKSQKIELQGRHQILVQLLLSLPILIGFVIPLVQLLFWAVANLGELASGYFWTLVRNTVGLAALAATMVMAFALLTCLAHRRVPSTTNQTAKFLASLGYAIPGMVIALGLLIPLAKLDNQLDAIARSYFSVSTGLLLTGSLFALVLAYITRFLTIGIKNIDAGLAQIKPTLEQSAASLGLTPWKIVTRLHLPVLRVSLLTGALLVFVDVMKELPATLMMRPFNFNTLAVRTYELASDERLHAAALPSLMIVFAGLLPVLFIHRLTIAQNQGR